MWSKLKLYIEGLWMNELYEVQKEYNKSSCLNPYDGDWRRIK